MIISAAGIRTLTSTKGATIKTHLTDTEALGILRTLASNNFAQDLYQKAQHRPLSESQLAWVHKLALENLQPAQPEEPTSLQVVLEMFAAASDRLKYPKIRLVNQATNSQLKLYVAGDRSRHPGTVQIVDEVSGDWYGRIELDGRLTKSRSCPAWVEALLNRFAAAPAEVAAEYGKLTGSCCFCLQALTDGRSVQVGYGPVCAKNYRLPWGN